jgi:hypothetical protein
MSNNAVTQSEDSQKAIIEAVAAATTKVLSETKPLETPKPTTASVLETTDSDKVISADSAEIDLEHEPLEKKRERQRSLVLNLGKKQNDLKIIIKIFS